MTFHEIGNTGIRIPRIIFGTSALGNLYQSLSEDEKLAIVKESLKYINGPVVFDSAGKYGAGLALEKLGEKLRAMNTPAERVVISNKIGWLRTRLEGTEPTFEKGVWMDIKNDARQEISYSGILKCWEQGNELLGEPYKPQLLSVHDPDEYLAMAGNDATKREKLYSDIAEAYRALNELKRDGQVKAIGVGAKDWRVIRQISKDIDLDWVMFANSLTIYNHPAELVDFIDILNNKGITIINSAVFNAGFLTGGNYFDYQLVNQENPDHQHLFAWREKFFEICKNFEVHPAIACINFGLSHPAIKAIALNTSNSKRIRKNVESVSQVVPPEFYKTMKKNNLINNDYPYA